MPSPSKHVKLLSLTSVPECTPDYGPYQGWRFTFQNFTYGDSAKMGDMVVYTQTHPDKAQARYPYDEARLRLAEEWEDEPSSDEDPKENKDKDTAAKRGSSGSKQKRAVSRKARTDKSYAMMMRRLGLYLTAAFKSPILVTMYMTVADRNPIAMLVLVEKRFGGCDMVDMIVRWQRYITYNPSGD